ncbi:uncharacterized protein B0I36DRAFT_348711 [Microdochium trichocladiopsis]|uniref:Secreted protein n=1 Tax=Microdochium trichocladiopsis TaxID=1682393 RepID=A0A9P8YAI8_9PEZI|nr:uncharacterized protein B0I36DRAFT_348711 [Microdochium trichocladiopsis]KAH7033681.1 hypothetical protein B0I36DRAFT_348711 [Microdochium trichocladiopsis]
MQLSTRGTTIWPLLVPLFYRAILLAGQGSRNTGSRSYPCKTRVAIHTWETGNAQSLMLSDLVFGQSQQLPAFLWPSYCPIASKQFVPYRDGSRAANSAISNGRVIGVFIGEAPTNIR